MVSVSIVRYFALVSFFAIFSYRGFQSPGPHNFLIVHPFCTKFLQKIHLIISYDLVHPTLRNISELYVSIILFTA